jgi:hypothetical protein
MGSRGGKIRTSFVGVGGYRRDAGFCSRSSFRRRQAKDTGCDAVALASGVAHCRGYRKPMVPSHCFERRREKFGTFNTLRRHADSLALIVQGTIRL